MPKDVEKVKLCGRRLVIWAGCLALLQGPEAPPMHNGDRGDEGPQALRAWVKQRGRLVGCHLSLFGR